MVTVNTKQLSNGFEPKGRLCVGGHRGPNLEQYGDAASPTALSLAVSAHLVDLYRNHLRLGDK